MNGPAVPVWRGHMAMLLFSALVAGSFSLGSLVANDIAPTALTAMRFGIASIVIGLVVVATGGIQRAAFHAPWRYLVLGGLFAGYFVLMFEGLKTASAVNTVAVFTLTPVISAGFGWLLLRQVTTPRMLAALAVGAAGAGWVIFRADWAAARAFEVGKGEMTYFVGAVAHALFIPMVRVLNRGESAVVFTLGTLVAGFVLLAIFGWSDIRATDWASLPLIVWVTLMYLALFASSATFVLLHYASLRLPAAKVMAYTYLTPTWVILWEIALGNDAPRGLIMVGIAMSVVALVMLLRQRDGGVSPAQSTQPPGTARTHPD